MPTSPRALVAFATRADMVFILPDNYQPALLYGLTTAYDLAVPNFYEYNDASTATDDGVNVITPTDAIGGPGRYLLRQLVAGYSPTINSAITRSINSIPFTVSLTKQAYVSYNVTIACTATIGSSASGSVALQFSTNGGTTWTTAATFSNSNTVTLAIVLNSIQTSGGQVSAYVPAGSMVKLAPTIVGTTTITYLTGQETY